MEDGEESSEVCSKTAYEVPVATFWGSIKRSQKNVHDSFTKSQVMLLLCMWFGILNGSSHLTQIQHHILLLTRLKFIFDLCDRNESEMNKHGHKRTHTQKSIRFSLKTRPTDAQDGWRKNTQYDCSSRCACYDIDLLSILLFA